MPLCEGRGGVVKASAVAPAEADDRVGAARVVTYPAAPAASPCLLRLPRLVEGGETGAAVVV